MFRIASRSLLKQHQSIRIYRQIPSCSLRYSHADAQRREVSPATAGAASAGSSTQESLSQSEKTRQKFKEKSIQMRKAAEQNRTAAKTAGNIFLMLLRMSFASVRVILSIFFELLANDTSGILPLIFLVLVIMALVEANEWLRAWKLRVYLRVNYPISAVREHDETRALWILFLWTTNSINSEAGQESEQQRIAGITFAQMSQLFRTAMPGLSDAELTKLVDRIGNDTLLFERPIVEKKRVDLEATRALRCVALEAWSSCDQETREYLRNLVTQTVQDLHPSIKQRLSKTISGWWKSSQDKIKSMASSADNKQKEA